MSAYMIVNVDVRDAVAYEEYKAKVPGPSKHGGSTWCGVASSQL
jgi:uncharacterized protein (DUF1330 family)